MGVQVWLCQLAAGNNRFENKRKNKFVFPIARAVFLFFVLRIFANVKKGVYHLSPFTTIFNPNRGDHSHGISL